MSVHKLFDYFDPEGDERCGVILDTGEIREVLNVHPEPHNHFAMPEEEVSLPSVAATWHTHPRTGPNLSIADYRAFTRFPALKHYIIARGEIWCYYMADDILLLDENAYFPRLPEGSPP